MISQRQVEREYGKIKTEPAKEEKINCYVCSNFKCNHITKTIDIHQGTTPMHFNCEKCEGSATSTWYKDVAPDQEPTQLNGTGRHCSRWLKCVRNPNY